MTKCWLGGWVYVSEVDHAAPGSNGNGLGSIAGAEFCHDVFDVDLYCFFRDEKLVGNIAVAVSTGQPVL
jgi:hypothetical protein